MTLSLLVVLISVLRQTALTCLGGFAFGVKRPSPVCVVLISVCRQTVVTCLYGIVFSVKWPSHVCVVLISVWRQTVVTCLRGIAFGVKRPLPVWVVLCLASNGCHLSVWYCVWRHIYVYGIRRSFSAYIDSVIKCVSTLKMFLNYTHNTLNEGF